MPTYSIGQRPNISRLGARACAALSIASWCVAPAAVAVADQGRLLSIESGHSIVVRGHDISRVAVGDAKVAGVVPLDKKEIVVNGKGPGETTVFVWDGGVRQAYELTVTDDGLDRVLRLLRTAIGQPDVQLSAVGSSIVVSGRVHDLIEYDQIDEIIGRFKGLKVDSATDQDKVIPVINAVTVEKPLGVLQDQINSIHGGEHLRVDLDAEGNVIVSGRVQDRQQEQSVLDQINGLAGPYLSTNGKVIDRLATDTASQVDIKVDVLEVDRTAQSQLGLRLQSAQPSGINGNGQAEPPYQLSSAPSFSAVDNPLTSGVPGKALTIGAFTRVSLLAPTLDLLIAQGHARLLSSPNLMAKPGAKATFLVGGEIPIPVSNGLGTVSIDYKEYGVQMTVTPTIDADGSIDSDITPEVSDLDFADGIQVNGFTVPALKTSRLQTDITTRNGQSIIMGGLLRRIEQKNILKIPLLGDIPILGELFRSTTYQRQDSDVIFVLTPTIVTSHDTREGR